MTWRENIERERDEAFKWIDVNRTRAEAAEQRAKELERENERLREALGKYREITDIARDALFPEDSA